MPPKYFKNPYDLLVGAEVRVWPWYAWPFFSNALGISALHNRFCKLYGLPSFKGYHRAHILGKMVLSK